MGEQRWSTEGLHGDDALDFWREAVAEAFVPVTVTADVEPQDFHGEVRAKPLGPLGVAVIDAQPQQVHRTPEPGPEQVFFLNLPLRGTARVSQDGQATWLRPGDFALLDSSRPFDLHFPEPFEQLSLVIPASLVPGPPSPLGGGMTGVAVSADSGAGHIASCALQALAHEESWRGGHDEGLLAHRLVDLVTLAAGSGCPTRAPVGGRLLLQAALDQVDRSLDDVGLSPAAVADAVGVSVRYLHRLFADEGTTFGRYVLQRRLERCHRELLDPALCRQPVSLTARRHGLPDPTHFARVYRARYGQTPREVRRGARP